MIRKSITVDGPDGFVCFFFSFFAVKADQQSKASTSQPPSSGEAMDITTPGDIAKVLVSLVHTCKQVDLFVHVLVLSSLLASDWTG